MAMVNSAEFGDNFLRGDFLYQDDQLYVSVTDCKPTAAIKNESATMFLFHCVVLDVDEDRQASIHYRVVPRKPLKRLPNATVDDEKLLGHLILVAKNLAVEKGLISKGYHVMMDENHKNGRLNSLHVFERALHHMLWPTGPGNRL